jgi:hypothetical protein
MKCDAANFDEIPPENGIQYLGSLMVYWIRAFAGISNVSFLPQPIVF